MLEEKVVLVVDDDLMLLDMYVERIKAEGAIVLRAGDGEEALKLCRENHPHIILLDVMMPKIDGMGVLKELKADPATADIPVIILTALSDERRKKESFELGAIDYIVKSDILPADVVTKIGEALGEQIQAT